MDKKSWLEQIGLTKPAIEWNLSPAELYEHAVALRWCPKSPATAR